MGQRSTDEELSLHFMGGPLDGYTELTDTPREQLPEVLGILVSPGIVGMLTNQRLEAETSATSLAFYQHEAPRGGGMYAFVGSTSPEVIALNDLGVPPSQL